MKFGFEIGIYLVLATTIAMLPALGSACRLSVTERVDQASAEAQNQRVLAKLEELMRSRAAVKSATLGYMIGRSA